MKSKLRNFIMEDTDKKEIEKQLPTWAVKLTELLEAGEKNLRHDGA
jgi:hypothetical protein